LAAANAQDEDAEEDGDDSPEEDYSKTASSSTAASSSAHPLRVRKCAFARGGTTANVISCSGERAEDACAGAAVAMQRLPEQVSTSAAAGQEMLARLWEHPAPLLVPQFVHGGLAGCQECGEDLYDYSVDTLRCGESLCEYSLDQALCAWSWLTEPGPPPARITSMVSTARADS